MYAPHSFGLEGMVLTANADLNHNFTGGRDHYQIKTLDFFFHFDTLDVRETCLFSLIKQQPPLTAADKNSVLRSLDSISQLCRQR